MLYLSPTGALYRLSKKGRYRPVEYNRIVQISTDAFRVKTEDGRWRNATRIR